MDLELWYGNVPVARLVDERGTAWVPISDLKLAVGLRPGSGSNPNRRRQGTDPSRMAQWVHEVDPRWTRQATTGETSTLAKRAGRPPSGGSTPHLVTREGAFVILNRMRSADSDLVRKFQQWVSGTLLPAVNDAGQLGASTIVVQQSADHATMGTDVENWQRPYLNPETADLDVLAGMITAIRATREMAIEALANADHAAVESKRAHDRIDNVETIALEAIETVDAVSGHVIVLADRVEGLTGHTQWRTAQAWSRMRNISQNDRHTMNRLSHIVGKLARADGLVPQKVPHERDAYHNAWPVEYWDMGWPLLCAEKGWSA